MEKVTKRYEEMKTVVEALKHHFGDGLEIDRNIIALKGYGKPVVVVYDDDSWDNKWHDWSQCTSFTPGSVFSLLHGNLTLEQLLDSINKPWSLQQFQEELLKEFPQLKLHNTNLICYNNYYVVRDGNVNFIGWHNSKLDGHPTFSLNGYYDDKILITEDNAEEFKQLLRDFFNSKPKELTVAEIEAELGYPVKVVK